MHQWEVEKTKNAFWPWEFYADVSDSGSKPQNLIQLQTEACGFDLGLLRSLTNFKTSFIDETCPSKCANSGWQRGIPDRSINFSCLEIFIITFRTKKFFMIRIGSQLKLFISGL